MSEKTRLPYREAYILAKEVEAILAPFAERIEIAGSIRRQAASCGDIEIVAVPKRNGGDLFGEPSPITVGNEVYQFLVERVTDLSDDRFTLRFNKLGRQCFGKVMMLMYYRNFALDVFLSAPENWGTTLMVRTGPEDFCRKLATIKIDGGFLPAGMKLHEWTIEDRGKKLILPEEIDVFNAIGLPRIEPEDRE